MASNLGGSLNINGREMMTALGFMSAACVYLFTFKIGKHKYQVWLLGQGGRTLWPMLTLYVITWWEFLLE
ncbi:hypothetical protein KY290_033204 [Solanum tuberosum]|uniref:Uncharacterized protein n=1 Tax=Solanum tuberosum TaxID=4113 RepID=A0ABQ7U1E9_SOLTU|nr:hypothetical protein KY285_032443 [Solanum tuberosum]KAH0740161.1 hypothetical protein KY290_033204 [Solanum tuberosum]